MTRREIANRFRGISERRRLEYVEWGYDLLADTLQDLWDDVERLQTTVSLLTMAERSDPIGVSVGLEKAKVDDELGLPPVGDE